MSCFFQGKKYIDLETDSTEIQENALIRDASGLRSRRKSPAEGSLQGNAKSSVNADVEEHAKMMALIHALLQKLRQNKTTNFDMDAKNIGNLLINNLEKIKDDELIKDEVKSICECMQVNSFFHTSFLQFVQDQPDNPKFEEYRPEFGTPWGVI